MTLTATPTDTDLPGNTALGPAYWRMWSASVISRVGDALRGPALALVAAAMTRDPQTIALVVIAGQLPPLIFGLLGGALADRWDRRWSMAGADGLRFLLVAVLTVAVWTGSAGIPVLIGFAFALSTVGTLFDASAFAIMPDLVRPDRLPTANARLQVGHTVVGGLVATPVAGVLFAVAAALPFAIDAVTFALAAALALTLPRPARPEPSATVALTAPTATRPEPSPAGAVTAPDATRPVPTGTDGSARLAPARRGRPGLWREALDGVRWLWREPGLRLLALLTGASNLVIGSLMAVLVLLVLEVFGVPEAAYGLFGLAGVVGAVLGGLTASRIGARWGALPPLRWILLVQSCALACLAVFHNVIAGGAALGVFIGATAVWNVLANSYQQQLVPRAILGRVGAASRVIGLVTAPIGAALGGLVADRYGVPAVAGFGVAVFALLTIVGWGAINRLGRPDLVSDAV